MQRAMELSCTISRQWIGLNTVYSQIIRWKRKPIWLPPAKSKLFRVPPRLRLPEEEAVEILRLYNHYRTYRKSIKAYLVQMVNASQVALDAESVKKAEDEDFARSCEINDKWNEKMSKIREVRLKDQFEQRRQAILTTIQEKKQRNDERMSKIDAEIKQAKIDASTFITSENIDEAIEKALLSTVNYNVAIDKEGHYQDAPVSENA